MRARATRSRSGRSAVGVRWPRRRVDGAFSSSFARSVVGRRQSPVSLAKYERRRRESRCRVVLWSPSSLRKRGVRGRVARTSEGKRGSGGRGRERANHVVTRRREKVPGTTAS